MGHGEAVVDMPPTAGGGRWEWRGRARKAAVRPCNARRVYTQGIVYARSILRAGPTRNSVRVHQLGACRKALGWLATKCGCVHQPDFA